MISRDKLLSDVDRLPTLPVSLARIAALADDEHSSIDGFEAALKPDPALSANLLKLANSAYFGCSRRITSIRQALTLLGTKKVTEVAMGSAFSRLIPEVLPGYGIDATAFWRHCIAVAVISETLSESLGLGDREECFTLGLLHDIGKLVTSTYLAREKGAVIEQLRQERCEFIEAERAVLGIDHAEVGAAVSERWQLPEMLCAAVRWHHQPENGGGGSIDLVHIADCLAHAMGYGADVGELSRQIDPGAQQRLQVSARGIEPIMGEAAGAIDDLCTIFDDTQRGV